MAYHTSQAKYLTASEIFRIFGYGLRLDVSFAAYISVFPFFLLLLQAFLPQLKIHSLIRVYTYFLIALIGLFTVIDLELYNAWGFRLDATPLQYLATPHEMMASAGTAPVFLLATILFILILLSTFFFRRYWRNLPLPNKRQYIYIGVSFLYLIILIIPIRGGIQQIPVNQSDVYFSDKAFANHAAVNLPWNLMYSLSKKNFDLKNPYHYFPDSTARQYVAEMYKYPAGKVLPVLKDERPNIIFIILESYTGKLVGCLGGEPGVTPNLDQLAKEGIVFDSIYASGDRTEKGLVALLSGYPVQTTTSIVKTPRKTEKLPHLNKILEEAGYQSSFFYGGELAFANIKSYLLTAGYDKLRSKYDFDKKDYNSKWGVHDHVLFNQVINELRQEKTPFFATIMTLSSHEPYDIPISEKFKGTDEATQFKNSVYYTDVAIGEFITAARKEPWWDNTLLILAADHGHRFPGNDSNNKPSKFRIPFILSGGALMEKGKVISKIGSQTDIVPTVLAQLDLPFQSFVWGKNLLNPGASSFAFYVFNDGFGFVSPQGAVTFDNIAKKIIEKDPQVPVHQLERGKAYMQYSFEDFLKK
ncbi:LTA synthase family protein [Adhaeribacter aquaticus]|uniref:LTA synthase family protein n=1 Tax=Adhaeribacter aquaticus TaxID=299567 RepID=UPI00040A367E|nr:LTA synthase family protein [Adhaeribacter aquaticus]